MLMTEIKKIEKGMSFLQYLKQIFIEHSDEIAEDLIEGLSWDFVESTTVVYDLMDNFGNKQVLEIRLTKGDNDD